jgi:hypothetical protein
MESDHRLITFTIEAPKTKVVYRLDMKNVDTKIFHKESEALSAIILEDMPVTWTVKFFESTIKKLAQESRIALRSCVSP